MTALGILVRDQGLKLLLDRFPAWVGGVDQFGTNEVPVTRHV